MSKETVQLMQRCAPLFSLLQDQKRLEILDVLFRHSSLTVNEIAQKVELSRPAISHHLKLMLDKELVSVQQKGKERFYSLQLTPALTLLKSLVASLEKDIS